MSTSKDKSNREAKVQTTEDDSKGTVEDVVVLDAKELPSEKTDLSTEQVLKLADGLLKIGQKLKFYDEKIGILEPVLNACEEHFKSSKPKSKDFFNRKSGDAFYYYLALFEGSGSNSTSEGVKILPHSNDKFILEIPNPIIIQNLVKVLYGFLVESKQEEMDKIKKLLNENNLTLEG